MSIPSRAHDDHRVEPLCGSNADRPASSPRASTAPASDPEASAKPQRRRTRDLEDRTTRIFLRRGPQSSPSLSPVATAPGALSVPSTELPPSPFAAVPVAAGAEYDRSAFDASDSESESETPSKVKVIARPFDDVTDTARMSSGQIQLLLECLQSDDMDRIAAISSIMDMPSCDLEPGDMSPELAELRRALLDPDADDERLGPDEVQVFVPIIERDAFFADAYTESPSTTSLKPMFAALRPWPTRVVSATVGHVYGFARGVRTTSATLWGLLTGWTKVRRAASVSGPSHSDEI